MTVGITYQELPVTLLTSTVSLKSAKLMPNGMEPDVSIAAAPFTDNVNVALSVSTCAVTNPVLPLLVSATTLLHLYK
jgi:hypothetical protein